MTTWKLRTWKLRTWLRDTFGGALCLLGVHEWGHTADNGTVWMARSLLADVPPERIREAGFGQTTCRRCRREAA